ncbi:MAG: hypothetical protein PHV37_09115 [Candidatus Gastranaerophilales bacterium]|nr:hypothetical protein [Candidatus Gastranaerophilales bacterium]
MFNVFKKFQSKGLNYSEKLIFLVDQTYKYYCTAHKKRISDKVDFHHTVYARKSTLEALKPVIAEKRVEKCFANCVSEMKQQGQTEELSLYGVA